MVQLRGAVPQETKSILPIFFPHYYHNCLPLMNFSEENRPELALNGTGNISITLVDYLTTKYDKTVRPRAASGDYAVADR